MITAIPDEMLERYSRHILLSEIDEEGQRKLLNAHLVCVGLGGLAASALPLLTGAGIGKITLIDGDRVDISNLSRQTLYNEQMVGAPKALCAAETLSNLNSEITITPINQLLSSDNSGELLKNADIIIDATDNFPARYRINAVACKYKIAFASASLMRFGGQISFFKPHFTENNITLPCYQCLYPEAPPENLLPRCDELGIFSPTASLFGVMLASEALKYLIGCGTLLTGRLLMLECDDWQWQNISFSHRADCPNNHSE
ncbi:MAG: HesA/MoeB/ThiF family protein [Alphaproteobacteria bacterium]|nr:HesA/MoeB/ThiF family protein [Alphaproteobacteria bacterium]